MTKLHLNKIDKELLATLNSYSIKANDNQVQKLALDLEEILNFQQSLKFPKLANIYLVSSKKELIEIFTLRNRVYKQMGYDKEFPSFIEGLDYDNYDKSSAILYTKQNNKITGTCRIIIDSIRKIPLDKNFSFDNFRKQSKTLAELSRLIIEKQNNGLGQEPKLLTKGTYHLLKANNILALVSVMKEENFRFYKNFGGFNNIHKFETYGNLKEPFIVTSWEIAEISKYFKRFFLNG